MSLPALHDLSWAPLARYIFEPALRSLALAGAVWLLLSVFRLRDISLRLAAWTVVLYAALAMPLLGGILPGLPVLLPIERAAVATKSDPPANSQSVRLDTKNDLNVAPPVQAASKSANTALATSRSQAPVVATQAPSPVVSAALAPQSSTDASSGTANSAPPVAGIPWLAIATGVYLLIAAVFLARFALGLTLSLRLRRSSQPIEDDRLRSILAREARAARVAKVPPVAESAALSVPVTLGVLRPVILFPPGWREWNETQSSAVLAHELSHVARADALTQTLSGLHRAIFWFSPLSWLLDRSLVDLAEQASDDEALRSGADRSRYAEVLLHFFRALKSAQGRVRWQAVSMAQGRRSARRLERILSGTRLSGRLGQTALAGVILAVVPLWCLAAAVRPALSAPAQIPALPATPAPPAPPAFALAPVHFPIPVPQAKPSAQAQSKRNSASKGPTEAQGPEESGRMGTCGGQGPVAIIWRTSSGSTIETECTTSADIEHFQQLRRRVRESFLWFRRDGRSYIVRDPDTVKAAHDAFQSLAGVEQQSAQIWMQQAALGQSLSQAMLGQMQELQSAMRAEQINFAKAQAEMQSAQEAFQTAFTNAPSLAATQQQMAQVQGQLEAAMQAFNSAEEAQARRTTEAFQAEMAAVQAQLSSLQQTAVVKARAEARSQATHMAGEEADFARRAAEQLQRLRHIISQAISRGLAKPE